MSSERKEKRASHRLSNHESADYETQGAHLLSEVGSVQYDEYRVLEGSSDEAEGNNLHDAREDIIISFPHQGNERNFSISQYLFASYSTYPFSYTISFLLTLLIIANNIAAPYFLTRVILVARVLNEEELNEFLLWLGVYSASWILSDFLPLARDEVLTPISSRFSHSLTSDVVAASYDLPMLQRITYSTPPSVHHFGIAYEHIGRSYVGGIAGKIGPSVLELLTAAVLLPARFGVIGAIVDGTMILHLTLLTVFSRSVAKTQNIYINGLMRTYAYIISKLDEYANVHYFGALARQLKILEEGLTRLDGFLDASVLSRNRALLFQGGLPTALAFLGTGLLYLYGSRGITPSLNEFIWVTLYLFQLFPDFQVLGETVNKFIADTESFQSLVEFLNQAHASRILGQDSLTTSSAPSLSFDGIYFSYENGQAVLENFSFQVKPGESVIITGSSGAGKSSIFKILQRFYVQQAGRILINGQNIIDVDVEELRALMAIVPQYPNLQSGTIYENIKYANPKASDGDILKAARRAGLLPLLEEKGFSFEVGGSGGRLSGGQRQRIAIARAYLRSESPILLMDEPTSALDPQTEEEILTDLDQLLRSKQQTTLIISHRKATVKHLSHVDRIIYLEGGRIAEQGTFKELMELDGLFAGQMKVAQREKAFHQKELSWQVQQDTRTGGSSSIAFMPPPRTLAPHSDNLSSEEESTDLPLVGSSTGKSYNSFVN